jgi:malic enzyme
MLDSQGLVFDGRDRVADDKRPFALPHTELTRYGFAPAPGYDLDSVVRQVAPTILIGTTGVAGSFTETAIRQMAARTPAPIVLPLSNPTAKAEATPADILAWSEGRAIVATGSPFDPVRVDGRDRLVGQANNVFIFPGVGLGAIVSRTREITDRMFLAAATTLAGMIPADRLASGALYPRLSQLRPISRAIAVAVAREARDAGLAPIRTDEQIEAAVDTQMWTPEYGGL